MKKIDWAMLRRGVTHSGPGYDLTSPSDPEAVYMRRVLRVFGDAVAHESLLWDVDATGHVRFVVNVSDVFEWGKPDVERITPEDLLALEEAYRDLKGLECTDIEMRPASRTQHVGILYAARRRQCRPLERAYPKHGDIGALLDACGPRERV